jgi:hypothetical protein
MAAPQPKSLLQSLEEAISQLLLTEGSRAKDNLFLFRRVEKELDALQKTDVVSASTLRAELESIYGNKDQMLRWLDNAVKNSSGETGDSLSRRFSMLINCGYHIEASKLVPHILAHLLSLSNVARIMTISLSGGVFELPALLKEASDKQSRVISEEPGWLNVSQAIELGNKALLAFSKSGTSQEAFLKALDIASEVMRDKKLLWLDSLPIIDVPLDDDHALLVRLQYRLKVSPEDAAELNWSLAEKLIENEIDFSGFSVGFIGVSIPTIIHKELAENSL